MPHLRRFQTLERRRLLAAGDVDLAFGGDDGDGVVNTGRWHNIHSMPNDNVLIHVGNRWHRINTNGAVVDTIELTGGSLPDAAGTRLRRHPGRTDAVADR